jgi:DNA ligase 1
MNFKPMLSADASAVDLEALNYPLLVSPKLDGVRCILWEGVAYSRNAKPIRNKFVQAWAVDKHNMDGELIVGSATEGEVLGRTQSGVMSVEGEPDFTFHLFDAIERYTPKFAESLTRVHEEHSDTDRVVGVAHDRVHNARELTALENMYLADGYEGVMLRSPDGPYKHGRGTLREGYLMKLKRFTDGEAIVVALEEAEENTNVATKDELNRTKRSTAKAGKVGKGMVGTIVVHDKKWGELRLAPGTMTHAERIWHWECRNDQDSATLLGKVVHWRCFGYGLKDKPRFPRFYGIREDA